MSLLYKPFKAPYRRSTPEDDSQATLETSSSEDIFTQDTSSLTNPKLNNLDEFLEREENKEKMARQLKDNNPMEILAEVSEEEKKTKSEYFQKKNTDQIQIWWDDEDEEIEAEEKRQEVEKQRIRSRSFVAKLTDSIISPDLNFQKRKKVEEHDLDRKEKREEASVKRVKYEMINSYQEKINQFETILNRIDHGIDYHLDPIFTEYHEEKNDLLLDYLGYLDGLRLKTERKFESREKLEKKRKSKSPSPTF